MNEPLSLVNNSKIQFLATHDNNNIAHTSTTNGKDTPNDTIENINKFEENQFMETMRKNFDASHSSKRRRKPQGIFFTSDSNKRFEKFGAIFLKYRFVKIFPKSS